MAASIAASFGARAVPSGGVADFTVTRAAGEGLLVYVMTSYAYGGSLTPTALAFDPSGDNDTFSQIGTTETHGSRKGSLWGLAAPTSTKTATLRVSLSGAGDADHAVYVLVRRVTGHDEAAWIRESAQRQETDPMANDLPITVDSADGDLVIAFCGVRDYLSLIGAGDAGEYVEYDNGSGGTETVASGTKLGASSAVTITFAYDETGGNFDNSLFAVSIAPASGAGSPPSGTVTITLADVVLAASGTVATNATGTIAVTLAGVTMAASGVVASADGTITTEPLKNNTGTVLASETGVTVHVYETTGELVVTKTAQTTDADGILAITDALIEASTEYRIVIVLGSGAEGMDRITAA